MTARGCYFAVQVLTERYGYIPLRAYAVQVLIERYGYIPLRTYAVQVLTERYGYSGEWSTLPRQLFDFISGRAAGNPKYIEARPVCNSQHVTVAPLHRGAASAPNLGSRRRPVVGAPRPCGTGRRLVLRS